MSATFLTTAPAGDTYPNLLVEVAIAWGADLTDTDGSGWAWTDITDDVILKDGGVSITLGRPDYSQETQTAEMTCVLDNRDGAYSEGGQSSHWPYVRRGTPVRVRVSTDNGSTWKLRFQGNTNGFTPAWDPETGRWATVTMSASGPLRRLNQGTLPTFSAMYVGTMADPTVKAYWPMEEGPQASGTRPAIGTPVGIWRTIDPESKAAVAGTPGDPGSSTTFPSSAPVMTIRKGGGVQFTGADLTSSSSSTTSAMFASPFNVTPGGPVASWEDPKGGLLTVYTDDGDRIKRWDIAVYKPTSGTDVGKTLLDVRAYGPPTGTPGPYFEWSGSLDTHWQVVGGPFLGNTDYEIGLNLSQSGSTTTWRMWINGVDPDIEPSSWTSTISSNSNGARVTGCGIALWSDIEGLGVGHVVVREPGWSSGQYPDAEWMQGHWGETPTDRIQRLCVENGIHLTTLDASVGGWVTGTDNMGAQYYDTLTNLLRECERTGQGILFDGLGPGLTYVTREYREKQAGAAPTLTVDASAAQLMEPFAPIDDDQLTINHCEASSRNTVSASHVDRTGPMGTEAIGDFATSVEVNTTSDDKVIHFAEWMVGVGTQTGYRYPTVSFALETNPSLIAGWLACTPQSRIDVKNITSIRRQHPAEDIRLLIEGWQEEITAFTWRVTANTSPAAPWNVIRLAAATGSTGDGVGRLQTVSSQLASNYTSGTSISVKTNSGNRWITTSEDSDSFPFKIDVGGYVATVTGISGTSAAGQTFTLSAALPRALPGSTTAGAGTPVKVWRPPVYAM